MLISVDKLSIHFYEDVEKMEHTLAELKKLEQAIEDSTHYKLLAGKTQMISRGKGKVKKERSRLLHTKAISNLVVKPQIEAIYDRILERNPIFESSEKYKRQFELNKQIAIMRGVCMAKAHDIGHVPFGHEGEKAISEFFTNITETEDIDAILAEHLKYFGRKYERRQGHIPSELIDEVSPTGFCQKISFEHNELSAILFNQIMEKNGIDLTDKQKAELTFGVLGHSTSRVPFEYLSDDLIAQIVRIADKVEYINYDYDEISELIKIDTSRFSKEQIEYITKTSPERIKETNAALVDEAFSTGMICEYNPAIQKLKQIRKTYDDLIYLYDGIYVNDMLEELLTISSSPEELKRYYDSHPGVEAAFPKENLDLMKRNIEILGRYRRKDPSVKKIDAENAHNAIQTEQMHFKGSLQGEHSEMISLMYTRMLEYYYRHPEKIQPKIDRTVNPIDYVTPQSIYYTMTENYSPLQKTLEYIASMDDQEMLIRYNELVEERIEQGHGHGVKPIAMYEIKQYLRNKYDAEIEKYRSIRSDEDKSHTFQEARQKYVVRCQDFFESKLTRRGKEVIRENYQERFASFAEEQKAYQRMCEKDAERDRAQIGERIFPSRSSLEERLEEPNDFEEIQDSQSKNTTLKSALQFFKEKNKKNRGGFNPNFDDDSDDPRNR